MRGRLTVAPPRSSQPELTLPAPSRLASETRHRREHQVSRNQRINTAHTRLILYTLDTCPTTVSAGSTACTTPASHESISGAQPSTPRVLEGRRFQRRGVSCVLTLVLTLSTGGRQHLVVTLSSVGKQPLTKIASTRRILWRPALTWSATEVSDDHATPPSHYHTNPLARSGRGR